MKKLVYLTLLFVLSIFLTLPSTALAATNALCPGVQNQTVNDIVLTEPIPDTFDDNSYIIVTLPQGITFAEVPVVEVIKGDLELERVISDDDEDGKSYLKFTVKNSSSKESTIKVSNIKVSVSRDVPVGPVYAEVSGSAINETEEDFPGAEKLKVQLGTVVGEEVSITSVVFSVDSNIYSLNGQSKIMDVSPFEKEGRVFVPIRYLLNTLGIADKDIAYENNQLVINRQGDKLELEIGSKMIRVNEEVKTIDVSPVVVNDRTMLPARYIVEALGGKIAYDDGKVIINLE